MDLTELYNCDSTFKGLISQWVVDRRAPVPLADRLLELGFELEAEGAMWAATKTKPSYPWDNKLTSSWWLMGNYWDSWGGEDHLPEVVFNLLKQGKGANRKRYRLYSKANLAILDYLEAYALALKSGADLPRYLTGVK